MPVRALGNSANALVFQCHSRVMLIASNLFPLLHPNRSRPSLLLSRRVNMRKTLTEDRFQMGQIRRQCTEVSLPLKHAASTDAMHASMIT